MGVYVTPIHTAEQADYRLVGSCGEERVAAADVAVEYRLGLSRGQDPILRLGSGWAEFDRSSGAVLATDADVEEMRRVVAGRDPRTGQKLIRFKTATSPKALLSARPLVDAVDQAAAEYGVSVEELLWRFSWAEDAARPRPTTRRSPWAWQRYNRLLRGLAREKDHHKAPVADLARIATAAGVDLAEVYPAAELAYAQEHADERVDIGTRAYDVVFTRDRCTDIAQAAAPEVVARRMEQIHDEAVAEAVACLERWVGYVMVGHHGDGRRAQRVEASGIIATATKHRTARAVRAGEPGDPHTHTHVMISVMGRSTVDGKWRTIAAGGRDLMRHVAVLGELQRAIERRKLAEEFGFRYALNAETGQWELAGIPATVKHAFSRRRNQAKEVAGQGASGVVSRAAARRLAERKVASTRAEERQSWQARMRAVGYPPEVLWRAALTGREPGSEEPTPRGPRPDLGPDPDAVAAAVWDPETGVTAHRKVVSRARVMAAVAAACPGVSPPGRSWRRSPPTCSPTPWRCGCRTWAPRTCPTAPATPPPTCPGPRRSFWTPPRQARTVARRWWSGPRPCGRCRPGSRSKASSSPANSSVRWCAWSRADTRSTRSSESPGLGRPRSCRRPDAPGRRPGCGSKVRPSPRWPPPACAPKRASPPARSPPGASASPPARALRAWTCWSWTKPPWSATATWPSWSPRPPGTAPRSWASGIRSSFARSAPAACSRGCTTGCRAPNCTTTAAKRAISTRTRSPPGGAEPAKQL